jgi:hypothetical protein
MPEPLRLTAATIDMTSREADTATVAASPTDATETVIATLTCDSDVSIEHGVALFAFAAWTVGTNGTASTLRIRQTNVSGTVVKSTGACTTAAASLRSHCLIALDTAAVDTGQVYVLTLQVTGATAGSTVSSAELLGIII